MSDKDLLKSVFGLNPAKFEGSTWKQIVSNDFKKQIFGDLFDGSKVFSCIADWAGKGLDIVTKGYDNLKEFGEVSARMVWETVTEFATEIVLDAGFHAVAAGIASGIAAGVAAVVGAPVTVPAVVVGIGAFALKAGADWACEKITGKDLTEYLSDTILDCLGVEDDKDTGNDATGGGRRWLLGR